VAPARSRGDHSGPGGAASMPSPATTTALAPPSASVASGTDAARAIGPASSEESVAGRVSSSAADRPAFGVLVVDDDDLICKMMKRWVSHASQSVNPRVTTCRSIAAARAAVEAAGVDAFAMGVFDLNLPDGSGVELCANLRQAGWTGHAVLHTGDSERLRELPLLRQAPTRITAVCVKASGSVQAALQALVRAIAAGAPLPAVGSGAGQHGVPGFNVPALAAAGVAV